MVPQKLQSRSKKSLILRAIILSGLLQIIQLRQLTASKMEKIFSGMVEQRSITNNGRSALLDSGQRINKVIYIFKFSVKNDFDLFITDHQYKMQTYVSHDLIADRGSFGSVMERFWLTSSGVALKVK